MKKALLMILDGYGFGKQDESNAIYMAKTPFMDSVLKKYKWNLLKCSGLDVGLPEGQMGNSEVGHLNIGAGRIVYQELTRISKSIKDGDFFENEAFIGAIENVKRHDSALHIMGLVSDGGVHSELEHCKALIKLATEQGIKKIFIHCFTDGRDTLPESGITFIKELNDYIKNNTTAKIADIIGRYYAMDRDKRYDRVKLAYDELLLGKGIRAVDPIVAVNDSYINDVTDEFIKPTVIYDKNEPVALIKDNDSVIFFNFRADRAREITSAIIQKDFDGFTRDKVVDVYFVCMTQYDTSLENVHIAFKPETMDNTLGEYLANKKIAQFRIAETEKYAHVTYFFNGGIETPNPGEDRLVIPSPKVATYDLQPEMSAYAVCDALIEGIKKDKYGFILVNFANCDMVGHTGVFGAAVKAVETVDSCAEMVFKEAKEHGYTMFITADHGNAELMKDNGEIITSHTTNKVIFASLDDNISTVNEGSLCDIAPTILYAMGLEKPKEMTGHCLIK